MQDLGYRPVLEAADRQGEDCLRDHEQKAAAQVRGPEPPVSSPAPEVRARIAGSQLPEQELQALAYAPRER